MKKTLLTILAFTAATFLTQAASHFAIAADHYATIAFARREPIFLYGIVAMLIQGAVLAALYRADVFSATPWKNALVYSWVAGAFLVSYIGLAEAAKYAVPSPAAWIAIESAAGFVQFSLFGLLLGVIHRAPHARH